MLESLFCSLPSKQLINSGSTFQAFLWEFTDLTKYANNKQLL